MDREVYSRIMSNYRRIRSNYKRNMFPKDNIARDTKTMRDRIITPIPLLSFAIAKKTTKP